MAKEGVFSAARRCSYGSRCSWVETKAHLGESRRCPDSHAPNSAHRHPCFPVSVVASIINPCRHPEIVNPRQQRCGESSCLLPSDAGPSESTMPTRATSADAAVRDTYSPTSFVGAISWLTATNSGACRRPPIKRRHVTTVASRGRCSYLFNRSTAVGRGFQRKRYPKEDAEGYIQLCAAIQSDVFINIMRF